MIDFAGVLKESRTIPLPKEGSGGGSSAGRRGVRVGGRRVLLPSNLATLSSVPQLMTCLGERGAEVNGGQGGGTDSGGGGRVGSVGTVGSHRLDRVVGRQFAPNEGNFFIRAARATAARGGGTAGQGGGGGGDEEYVTSSDAAVVMNQV